VSPLRISMSTFFLGFQAFFLFFFTLTARICNPSFIPFHPFLVLRNGQTFPETQDTHTPNLLPEVLLFPPPKQAVAGGLLRLSPLSSPPLVLLPPPPQTPVPFFPYIGRALSVFFSPFGNMIERPRPDRVLTFLHYRRCR